MLNSISIFWHGRYVNAPQPVQGAYSRHGMAFCAKCNTQMDVRFTSPLSLHCPCCNPVPEVVPQSSNAGIWVNEFGLPVQRDNKYGITY